MIKSDIPSAFFIENRKKLAGKLRSGSIAVLNSNDVLPTNADGTMHFKQNNDLFYLTGIEQEDTILLLFPDAPESKDKEILFIRDVNEELITWEGSKLDNGKASNISGVNNVMPVSKFEHIFRVLMSDAENLYLNTNEHKRATIKVQTRDDRFVEKCRSEFPLHNYYRLAPILYRLRAVKSEYEIELMKKACDLTNKGFRRVLKFIKPGVMEYEIEAEFAHEFISQGSTFADYYPIIATGLNACALHYEKNNAECKDGQIVLMDTAAMYANYNADMTRTVPVNGKFSKRHREVYEAVLRVMKDTIKFMTKGKKLDDVHKETESCMEKELIGLGLIRPNELKNDAERKAALKKYYPHGVSHFIGLDVHDVGYFHEILQPGNVLTCEPGIYIREEGFGIRLENNIVITETGNIDIMKSIPVEPDEIEELMNSK